MKLEVFLEKVRAERQRNADLPGSEWDANNTPGDWVAMISHYVASEVRRNGVVPETEEFEDKLVKATAVIAAALEHIEVMRERGELQ